MQDLPRHSSAELNRICVCGEKESEHKEVPYRKKQICAHAHDHLMVSGMNSEINSDCNTLGMSSSKLFKEEDVHKKSASQGTTERETERIVSKLSWVTSANVECPQNFKEKQTRHDLVFNSSKKIQGKRDLHAK